MIISDDFLLGPDGDLRLSETGDAVLGNSLVQRINITLRWFLTEWPFDESQGVDWYGRVFVKNPNVDDIRYMIEETIRNVDGVSDVTSVTVQMDSQRRTASIFWNATSGKEQVESEVIIWGSNTA